MQQQRNYMPAGRAGEWYAGGGAMQSHGGGADWSGEISPPARPRPPMDTGMGGMSGGMWNQPQSGMQSQMQEGMSNSMQGGRPQSMQESTLDMQNNLPDEVIESPVSNAEVYAGSLKAMLRRNLGNYVVATFLVGTQNTVSWEGVLYDVGNDYVTIYQEGRDRYIVNDIYSLKYMEFYDVQRRRLCDRLLMEQGWDRGENWSPSR
ncbi:MAG: hypothetical protein IKU81_00600 [Oscillibacter sp.]|nr:hypothetical protein [Oscillibacter sp.]